MNLDNIWEILLALTYFLGSALYDHLKRRKRAQNREDEPQDASGDSAGKLDPLDPRPPIPEVVVEPPRPVAMVPRVEQPSLRPALLLAIADWEREGEPVLGEDNTRRVRHTLAGVLPGLMSGGVWTQDDERVAELYLHAVRQLIEHVTEGTRGTSFLIGQTAADLLNPLLEDLHDDPGTEPGVVLPVNMELHGDVEMLAHLCSYEPVPIPEGSENALDIFRIIQHVVLEILVGHPDASRELAVTARQMLGNYLMDEGVRDNEVVRALQRYGGVATVVQGIVGAWVVRCTGPLLQRGLAFSQHGLSRSVPEGLVYGLCDLGEAGNEAEYQSLPAWRDFCVRLDHALDEIALGHRNRKLGSYATLWSDRAVLEHADLMRWLASPEETGSLRGRVDARSALFALIMPVTADLASPGEENVRRLKVAVLEGVVAQAPLRRALEEPVEPPPAPAERAGALKDAFLLQVILGPPRSHARVGLRRPRLQNPGSSGRSVRL